MRTDHVGSLLRPAEVLSARSAFQAGELPLERLREIEDRAILDAFELQEFVGLEIFTDGEIRRDAWMSDFADAVEGFVDQHRTMLWHRLDGSTEEEPSRGKVVAAKLVQSRRITGYEMSFLRAHAPGAIKMTMPSPVAIANGGFKEGVTEGAYATREDLLEDLVRLTRAEMLALVEDGVSYIQLDEGFVGYVQDPSASPDPTNLMAQLAADIAAENACYDALPAGQVTRGAHLCRGNSRSRWTARGGYDRLAERLFNELHVDRFLLEYDSERAGGFEPLRFVPKGKTVVLGLVSTKVPVLESQDELLRRIDEASRFIDAGQLAISPQCGFASTAEGNLVTPDDQRRKLELVVDTARRAWQ